MKLESLKLEREWNMDRRLTVWIWQTGEYLPVVHPEQRPMRAANLTRALREAGHRVVLWTSDWSHQEKAHIFGRNTKLRVDDSLEIRFVHSRGYQRHVGLSRLIDHAQLATELTRLLRNEEPPDVGFVGYPPIEPAAVMISALSSWGVPSLIDVKDIWPESLTRPFPAALKGAARIAISPYRVLARRAIGGATGITSMTDEFLDWSLGWAGRPRGDYDRVVPLTAPASDLDDSVLSEAADWWDDLGVPDDGRLRAVYVGALCGHLVIRAIQEAAEGSEWQFVLCGAGSHTDALRHAVGSMPNVVIPGWVNLAQAQVLYERATVGIAPYIGEEGFRLSIPNKFLDAFRCGLPMVSSVVGTTERLLNESTAGLTYQPSDFGGLRRELARLARDPELVAEMGENARTIYQRQFSYEKVYGSLVEHLERLADR